MGSGRLKAALAAFFLSFQAHALDPAAVEKLAFGDGDEKIEAIGALVAEGDPKAAELLKAFAEGELQTSGKRVLIVKGKDAFDQPTARQFCAWGILRKKPPVESAQER